MTLNIVALIVFYSVPLWEDEVKWGVDLIKNKQISTMK